MGAGYYEHARTEVLPYLPLGFAKVVDVGGSAGGTLSAIKDKNPSAVTICIDRDEPSIERARECGHIAIRCDLNDSVPDVLFDADVVMFLDILEHLVDPWRVLRQAAAKMKVGAIMIVSLPNVRFAPVSLGLVLRGKWELQDAGVLDRTHLRFFTKATGAELVMSSGVSLSTRKALVHNSRKYRYIDTVSLGFLRDLLSPQYLYVGVKT